MLKKFLLIYGLMNQTDKRRLMFIVVLSLINGVLGVAGIASIVPFIGLISDPALAETGPQLDRYCKLRTLSQRRLIPVSPAASHGDR